MSETEDDDGGIDKEALREELREKYEEDDTEREATQRMSDLLLKGATMTNSHCNTCGDPLFQQNGTTFCPTCHGGPEGVDASAAAKPNDGTDGQQSAGANGQSASADAQRPSSTPQPADSDPTTARQPDPSPSESAADSAAATPSETHTFDPEASPTNPDGPAAPDPADRWSTAPDRRGAPEPPERATPTPPADGAGASAADSLQAALERFAREAARTDDPRYARDCLEAAHEAADALAALRR